MDTDQQIKEKVDLITSEIKNDLANEMEERLATMQELLNKSMKIKLQLLNLLLHKQFESKWIKKIKL